MEWIQLAQNKVQIG